MPDELKYYNTDTIDSKLKGIDELPFDKRIPHRDQLFEETKAILNFLKDLDRFHDKLSLLEETLVSDQYSLNTHLVSFKEFLKELLIDKNVTIGLLNAKIDLRAVYDELEKEDNAL